MNVRLLLLASWAAAIFVGSSIPGSEMPDIGETDWILHGLEYMVLGGLALNWVVSLHRFPVWSATALSWLGSVLYGASDELHQLLVPGRWCSLHDLAADSAGALLGVAAMALWFARRRGYREKR